MPFTPRPAPREDDHHGPGKFVNTMGDSHA